MGTIEVKKAEPTALFVVSLFVFTLKRFNNIDQYMRKYEMVLTYMG